MKKHSCGAILYTIYKNKIYIILGKEEGEWFPFKGTCEKGETIMQAAIREISEETCKLVNATEQELSLDCVYQTKRKYYHIGLLYVDHTIVNKFYKIRQSQTLTKFLEKTEIKMFSLNDILKNTFHTITQTPILFYWSILQDIQNKNQSLNKNNLLKYNKNSIMNKVV
jgi:8-oxo-dGTP pyrophosphatase MutT (NUDIX family)